MINQLPMNTILYGSPLFFAANAFRSKFKSSFGVSIFAIFSFNEFLTYVVDVVNEFVFVFNKLFFILSHKFSACL
jgi:hypothetical protein